MRLTLVGVGLLIVCFTMDSFVTGDSSASDFIVNRNRQQSYKSESTEQLTDDGRDEVRRIENPEDWSSWDGKESVDLVEPAKSEGVTRAEKIEAFTAFVVATFTAICCNILTKAAVHRLS